MFNYAQSNSLLQQEIDDQPARDVATPSKIPFAGVPVAHKIPRWQHELLDHNGIPVGNNGLSEVNRPKRRNSRNSKTAAITSDPTVAAISISSSDTTSDNMYHASAAFTSAAFTNALPAIDDSSKETMKKKKMKEKTTSAKKSKQAKHKLAATAIGNMTAATTPTAIAPTSTAATPNVAAYANLNSATDMEIENKPVTIKTVDTKPSESRNFKAPTNNDKEQKPKKPRVRKPRRNIPKQKDFIPENEQPTENDVVGGRGGRSNHHPGNRPYWIRILESRNEYIKSRSDHEKSRIADGILRYVVEELRGRFLNIDSKTKRWYTLPNSVVLDKIKQALRDKYIPYWARDLKIENKKQEPFESILGLTQAVTGNNTMLHNIENNRPQHMPHHMPQHMPQHMQLHSTLPFANMHDPHTVHPSVALAEMEAARAKAANAMAAAATSRANAAAAAAKAANEAANAAAAAIPNDVNPANKSTNKLDFLLGRSARRPMGQTSVIPTVDDILKCKVDQMAAFRSMTTNAGIMAAAMANATSPPIPSLGMNPFNSVGVRSSWMASIGLGNSLSGGGMMGETMNNPVYGNVGNMGAPALPGPSSTLPASLGALHSVTMRSLDKYLEEKLAEKIAGVPAASLGSPAFTAANLPSLSRLNALAGTSFDSAASSDPAAAGLAAAFATPVAAAPAASKKTDWNAMYTRALTNSKPV